MEDQQALAAEVVDNLEVRMRQIVREEIASLAGLALRRTQDRDYSRDPDRNLALEVTNEEAAQFWGEVLATYGTPLPPFAPGDVQPGP